MAGPKMLVPPPSFDPRNFGLLTTVQARYDEPDQHWRNGVIWQDICGLGGNTFDPYCLTTTSIPVSGAPPAPKADNIDWNTYGAIPFTVFAEVDCSPVGYSQEEQRARAMDALTRTEAYQVENAFWTGTAGGSANQVYPHLAASAAVQDTTLLPVVNLQCAATAVSGTTVLDMVEALGRLEAALAACYQGKGVIHVPVILATQLFQWNLVKVDGAQLRTQTGNLVAIGGGYPGTAPTGVTPSNAVWIYATGPIFAYRSAAFTFKFAEQLDRTANTLKTIAERTYVLGYSCCCLPATPVSVGGDITGQPLSAF
jgi:hypothetical protein